MMSRRKGVLLAVAPITALLVLAAGARFLPSLQQTTTPDDEAIVLPSHSQTQDSKPHVKPAPLKPADAKTQIALKHIVGGQLSAFAKDDFAAALRYGNPAFQRNYSPDAFRRMVQVGYADLLNPKAIHYQTARCSGDRALMPVSVTAASGRELAYVYVLEKSDGEGDAWYVSGVSPIPPQGYPGAAGAPDSPHMTDVRDL